MKRIVDFFSSTKLALVLFTLISAAASLGTFIGQNMSEADAVQNLFKIFGKYAHSVYNFAEPLGLTNLYGSLWFNGIIFIFLINLIVCSITRLKPTLKILMKKIEVDKNIEGKPSIYTIESSKDIDSLSSDVKKIFGSYSVAESKEDGKIFLAFEKGRFSRSGVFVTHIGIILIIIGAFIGGITGTDGTIGILEGTKDNVLQLKDNKSVNLDFEIFCEDFKINFYDNSMRPKAYDSKIKIIDHGKETKLFVGVNKPAEYKGYKIYQSSYGFYPNRNAIFKIKLSDKKGFILNKEIHFGDTIEMHEKKISIKLSDFAPALSSDSEGKLINLSGGMMNPAVLLDIKRGDEIIDSRWVLSRYPESGDYQDFNIQFTDIWGVEFTVLSMKKDNAVFIVYIGFIILSIGILTAFYTRHYRVWVNIMKGADNSSKVQLYGNISKGKSILDRYMQENIEKIVKE